MAAEDISDKERINMLSPINNIFGTHEGRTGPLFTFLAVAVAPCAIYLFMLMTLVPLKIFLIFEVLWTARWALKILGKEDKRLENYRTSKRNEYESSKTLINIAHCYDSGMIEYENGTVSIIITGYTRTYFNDNVYSADMKTFLTQLDKYTPDIYLHQVVKEHNLQDMSENLRVYDDKVLMAQRMDIYKLNDDYVNENSKLWRFSFAIKTYKHSWKTTMEELESIVSSNTAKRLFFTLEIADKELVSNIASRDICTYVSISEMLREKYANEDYDGSKVIYYGDNVPDAYREEERGDDMVNRRIVYKEDNEEEW